MKYRRLGKNGLQVSAVGMGRGSQPVQFGDLTCLSEVFAIGAGVGARYPAHVLKGVGL